MKTATASIEGVSPYSMSSPHRTDKLEKESAEDYEKRTWRERVHAMPDGRVFIPPSAFKNCLSEAARYLSVKIPGKRNATYTKHFEAGVLVPEGLVLPVTKDKVLGEWLFLNADGKRGGGTRVWKCYPRIDQWAGDLTFMILDETITEDVFHHHLEEAGRFIGIGRFRPRNNGFYGRFKVNAVSWS